MLTTDTKTTVIAYGVKSRIKKGENLEDILNTYKNLTDEEKEIIRSKIS